MCDLWIKKRYGTSYPHLFDDTVEADVCSQTRDAWSEPYQTSPTITFEGMELDRHTVDRLERHPGNEHGNNLSGHVMPEPVAPQSGGGNYFIGLRRDVIENHGGWDLDDIRSLEGKKVSGGRSHGKRHRKGRTWRQARDVHICRRDTHRQCDYLWLVEMTNDFDNYGRMSNDEIYLDALAELDEIRIEYEDNLRDYEAGAYYRGPWDAEYRTPTHGYHGDPFEESYGLDAMDDPWYDDFIDRYEHGVLTDADMVTLNGQPFKDYDYDDWPELRITPEEWAAMEAEDRAIERKHEAQAEELEARFEHFPFGNAVGRRMRLAQAQA